VVVRGNFVYDRVSGPTHRLDLTFKPVAGAAARALPHGLVGQSFSSAAPRNGKVDSYPLSGRFTTSAMAPLIRSTQQSAHTHSIRTLPH